MKMKKGVSAKTKSVDKKNVGKKGMLIKSQLKAGGFWEDMRTVYGMKSS
jgi:hypothetical protein